MPVLGVGRGAQIFRAGESRKPAFQVQFSSVGAEPQLSPLGSLDCPFPHFSNEGYRLQDLHMAGSLPMLTGFGSA